MTGVVRHGNGRHRVRVEMHDRADLVNARGGPMVRVLSRTAVIVGPAGSARAGGVGDRPDCHYY